MIILAGPRSLLARRFVRVWALAGLALLASVARGDVDVWSNIGPNGGSVFSLAIDPVTPSTFAKLSLVTGGPDTLRLVHLHQLSLRLPVLMRESAPYSA